MWRRWLVVGLVAGIAVATAGSCGAAEEPPDAGVDAGTGGGSGAEDDGGSDAGPGDAGLDGGADAGVAACVAGADCESGLCLPGGDCHRCTADEECRRDSRCGTGTCHEACTTAAGCPAGHDCCDGRCVDVRVDVGHCGGCGQDCGNAEFCGGSSCHVALFSNVCALPVAVAMFDGSATDDAATLGMATALATGCTPAVAMRTAGQADAGVLRVSDGEPLAQGELLVTGGGSFRQRAMRWLESQGLARVRDSSSSSVGILTTQGGNLLVAVPLTSLGPGHDVAAVQVVRAPSGAVVLNAAGFYGAGTAAAAWYFAHRVLNSTLALALGWKVVEWTDANGNLAPDEADTWTVVGSGP